MPSLDIVEPVGGTATLDPNSILRGFASGAEGQLIANQRSLLRSAGEQAASGDLKGASQSLLRGGEIQGGLDLAELDDDRKRQVIGLVTDYAKRAQTPEQWTAFSNTMKKWFGTDSMGEFDSFDSRPNALTMLEQIDMDIKKTDLAKKQKDLSAPQSDVGKLAADRDAGVISPDEYGAAFKKKTAMTGGMSVTTNPDGTVSVEMGGQDNQGLGKTAMNQVQEKALNASDLGARISSIAADFKPEYLTVGRRLQNAWQSGLAKVDPKSVSEGDRKAMTEFATFKSRAYDNLNALLKELSGAAVTPQEFDRLKVSLPNPGTGVFDGDDPITFEAKLNRSLDDVQKSLARYRFYQATGIPNSLEEIPLTNVKNVDGSWFVKNGDKWFGIGEVTEVPAP